MSALRVLVTGSSGFVGAALVRYLLRDPSTHVIAAGRRPAACVDGAEFRLLGELGAGEPAVELFADVDVLVHAAARVHVLRDDCADPLAEYRRVNVAGTLELAHAAARAGVKRFIFVSSIKVNGEESRPGMPFTAQDQPAPQDDYGISKLEAEIALRRLSAQTGMELVIIRPPLVYGPGVKANFLGMMRWLQRGLPLPLGGLKNSRSLVALENLVDLLAVCLRHPQAADRVFLVADGDDLSTSELLVRLGRALGRPARLLSVPEPLLRGLLGIAGLGRIRQRLCASLQVDIGETCRLLGWRPPVTVEAGLREAARHFQERTC